MNIADTMTKRQFITTHRAEVEKNNLTWNGDSEAKRAEHIANTVTRVTKKAPPPTQETRNDHHCVSCLRGCAKTKKYV